MNWKKRGLVLMLALSWYCAWRPAETRHPTMPKEPGRKMFRRRPSRAVSSPPPTAARRTRS